jgi:hypothetical protein
MAITLSPNMNLPVPGVGTEAGPAYATDVNNCLGVVDSHDHSPGSGVQITPAGININTDLPVNNENITLIRSVRFLPQPSSLVQPTDLGCLYEVGVDLYYNDGSGNVVRITQGGGIAGAPGNITNLTAPASAAYVSGTATFVWQSNTLTPANLDAASIVLRNLVASSPGLTLSPPTLTADYTITLPSLPASNLPVSISASGVMSAAPVTLTQLSSQVQAKINTTPTVQKFLTGSGTYTLPNSPTTPLYIRVRMSGAGGGGGGISGAIQGSTGGSSTFGTFTAIGGTGGTSLSSIGGAGGVGGTCIAVGAVGLVVDGGDGGSGESGLASPFPSGGSGGSNPLGGSGRGATVGAPGAGKANTGAGGGGAQGANNGLAGSGGGGAGGYMDIIISSPAVSYSYAVGAGGANGAGGGAAGADGIIIVEEYYC